MEWILAKINYYATKEDEYGNAKSERGGKNWKTLTIVELKDIYWNKVSYKFKKTTQQKKLLA